MSKPQWKKEGYANAGKWFEAQYQKDMRKQKEVNSGKRCVFCREVIEYYCEPKQVHQNFSGTPGVLTTHTFKAHKICPQRRTNAE